MYELADWGRPAPAEWSQPRERVEVKLPAGMVRVLRGRARAEGISMSVLMQRLVAGALNLDSEVDIV